MEVKLVDEEMNYKNISLYDFLYKSNNVPSGWEEFFEKDIIENELWKISDYLIKEKGKEIYPSIYRIFRIFYLIPLDQIKIICCAMDPFHTPDTATGIAFDVHVGRPINPSLRNIYKELKLEGFQPIEDGQLLRYVEQGVFLVNMSLTVRRGEADSHSHIWYKFSELLVQYIVSMQKNLIWLLLGKNAQEFSKFIPSNTHKCFFASHPSPLGAYRGFFNFYGGKKIEIPAFIGSGIFNKINDYLISINRNKIKW